MFPKGLNLDNLLLILLTIYIFLVIHNFYSMFNSPPMKLLFVIRGMKKFPEKNQFYNNINKVKV